MNRKASVIWQGTFRQGSGTLSTESGALLKTEYSYRTCFEEEVGINPYELIAGALAACYAMALSRELELVGFSPSRIDTTVTVTLERFSDEGMMTQIQMDVSAQVPDATEQFISAVLEASQPNCTLVERQHFHDCKPECANNIFQFNKQGATRKLREPSRPLCQQWQDHPH
jgi:osmotically inducible protein OsmC